MCLFFLWGGGLIPLRVTQTTPKFGGVFLMWGEKIQKRFTKKRFGVGGGGGFLGKF